MICMIKFIKKCKVSKETLDTKAPQMWRKAPHPKMNRFMHNRAGPIWTTQREVTPFCTTLPIQGLNQSQRQCLKHAYMADKIVSAAGIMQAAFSTK